MPPPRHISEPAIQNFLSHNLTPLQPSDLPSDTRDCPICLQAYAPQDPNYLHPFLPADTHEYPVQVTTFHSDCMHILGRQCCETHLRKQNPWSYTCPLCRGEWFAPPRRGRAEVLGHLERALNVLSGMDMDAVDGAVAKGIEAVEEALDAVREILYLGHWI